MKNVYARLQTCRVLIFHQAIPCGRTSIWKPTIWQVTRLGSFTEDLVGEGEGKSGFNKTGWDWIADYMGGIIKKKIVMGVN